MSPLRGLKHIAYIFGYRGVAPMGLRALSCLKYIVEIIGCRNAARSGLYSLGCLDVAPMGLVYALGELKLSADEDFQ